MAKLMYKSEIAKKLKPGRGQTIRRVGKHKYEYREQLYHFTGACKLGQEILLGTSTVSEVVPITIQCLKDTRLSNEIKITPEIEAFAYIELAKDDGFNSLFDFNKFFINTYKLKPGDRKDFIIVKWKDFEPAKNSSHARPVGSGPRGDG